ncbi:hypothetical protein ACFSTC_51015 [Nonomuraea ferruginea]
MRLDEPGVPGRPVKGGAERNIDDLAVIREHGERFLQPVRVGPVNAIEVQQYAIQSRRVRHHLPPSALVPGEAGVRPITVSRGYACETIEVLGPADIQEFHSAAPEFSAILGSPE